MIDVHTHVLPNIDDGASTVDESQKMLVEAQKQGVKLCIATPHCVLHDNEMVSDFLEARDKAYRKLKSVLEENKELPRVFLGAEVYLDNNISKYPDVKKLCLGNSDYMLIEMPRYRNGRELADWIYELTLIGIKPIIAHIDRYSDWLELVKNFGGMDVIYQINASKFLTIGGRRFVRKFMKYNKPIVVGSDMHNTEDRSCNIGKAYRLAKRKFGEVADYFFRVENEVGLENV